MEAPDKIYIAETPNKLIEIWSDEPVESKYYLKEHCYVRKEALVEWAANHWLAFKRSDTAVDAGFSYAMEELIKKLNEM